MANWQYEQIVGETGSDNTNKQKVDRRRKTAKVNKRVCMKCKRIFMYDCDYFLLSYLSSRRPTKRNKEENVPIAKKKLLVCF